MNVNNSPLVKKNKHFTIDTVFLGVIAVTFLAVSFGIVQSAGTGTRIADGRFVKGVNDIPPSIEGDWKLVTHDEFDEGNLKPEIWTSCEKLVSSTIDPTCMPDKLVQIHTGQKLAVDSGYIEVAIDVSKVKDVITNVRLRSVDSNRQLLLLRTISDQPDQYHLGLVSDDLTNSNLQSFGIAEYATDEVVKLGILLDDGLVRWFINGENVFNLERELPGAWFADVSTEFLGDRQFAPNSTLDIDYFRWWHPDLSPELVTEATNVSAPVSAVNKPESDPILESDPAAAKDEDKAEITATDVNTDNPILDYQWQLVFADEFNNSTVSSQWDKCFWWDQDGCTNSGSDEEQWYKPENVIPDPINSRLRLQANEETVNGYDYTSGMVSTANSFAFKYGYIEARMRMPSGTGLWPNLALLAEDKQWPPEINVVETHGDRSNWVSMGHIYDDSSADGWGEKTQEHYLNSNLHNEYHKFAIYWEPGNMKWYIDNQVVHTTTTGVPTENMYVLANLAVGGPWAGSPDSSTSFPAHLDIDYIRVWQRPGDFNTVDGEVQDESGRVPVYRFYSNNFRKHFFTTSVSEREKLIYNDPNWDYEGIGYYAVDRNNCETNAEVYRFWSPNFKGHFYTNNKSEYEKLRTRDNNWQFEKIGYCRADESVIGRIPLYRFYSLNFDAHFYTTSVSERNKLIYEDPNWDYEGIGFYVLP